MSRQIATFNSSLETGVRSVSVLVYAYPKALDLQQLIVFDYIVVHTGDMGGPESLHPQLPMRSTELLVRRKIIENGLLLMISRGLVERFVDTSGILYHAGDQAEIFLSALTAPYLQSLRERAKWVANTFGDLDETALKETFRGFFDEWIEEFQSTYNGLVSERYQ